MQSHRFKLVDKYPIDPSLSGKAVFWIADAYYKARKFDEAIKSYKRFGVMPATSAQGYKSEALYNIGYCYLEKADSYHELKKEIMRESALRSSNQAFRSFIDMNPKGDQKKADAFMRIADSYFVLKNNVKAIENYKSALAFKAGYEDQALYYIAKTYGYTEGKLAEKISNLLDIVNNYPESPYLQAAIEEIARTYLSNNQYDKALQYYNKIIFDYPESELFLNAKISVADIHFKQGKYNVAEEEYLQIIQEFGSDNEICSRVAQGLKQLYTAIGKPDKIETLAAQYSCFKLNADEKENLYYGPAIEAYQDSTLSDDQRHQQAIPKLEKYLSKFPNGTYKVEIQHYLANCYYELENFEKAIEIYRDALTGSKNSFTRVQASRVSSYLFNNGMYEEAIPYYKRLEQSISDPEIQFNSKLGLMRSHYQIENWQNASLYADKVLASSQIKQ